MAIPTWEDDKRSIIPRLNKPASLKIATKTFNEVWLIEKWIQHHAKIVGFDNLIVADNGSNHVAVQDVYERYQNRVLIFGFKGPHNEFHWHTRFSDFYDAIRTSTRYFALFDSDEFLIWSDGQVWEAGSGILQRLPASYEGIIPTTWLINSSNSFERFTLLDTEGRPRIENNLRWGKPILPSYLAGSQPGMHNVQFMGHEFNTDLGTSLFTQHMTQFPAQRIAANCNKLINRGFIAPELSVDEIANMDTNTISDETCKRFVLEIQGMLAVVQFGFKVNETEDTLLFRRNGQIQFSTLRAKGLFHEHIQNGESIIQRALSTRSGGLPSTPEGLLRCAIEARSKGLGQEADIILRMGSQQYPNFLDEYGDPAFRKEAFRTLLSRGQFEVAKSILLPDDFLTCWPSTLLARAHTQAGRLQLAVDHWRAVLEIDSRNGEALKSLKSPNLPRSPSTED